MSAFYEKSTIRFQFSVKRTLVEMFSLNLNEILSVEGACCLPTANQQSELCTIKWKRTTPTKTLTTTAAISFELRFVEVLKQLILFFQRLHVHKTEVSIVFALHPINISKWFYSSICSFYLFRSVRQWSGPIAKCFVCVCSSPCVEIAKRTP